MGLIDGLSGVIYSNLIREGRYLLFFQGLWTTLEITAFALLLGIVIGTLVALVRVMHVKVLDKIAKAYVDIIRGTPAVVQLVIIYYAILGGVNLPKVLVASVAFAINSGAYVSELIRGGILAIDKGQMEAGRSVGLTYATTMRYIIIPQAFKNVLPALGNELITLVKETSVVTVIGLRDLTKGAMIVQAKTYQALVPYVAIAAIYLVIVMFLTWIMGKMERRLRQSDLR